MSEPTSPSGRDERTALPPPPPAEGGPTQSQVAPGDPERELIHEVRNLATAVGLLSRQVARIEARVEEAKGKVEGAEIKAATTETRVAELARARWRTIRVIALSTAIGIVLASFTTMGVVSYCFITNGQRDIRACHAVPGYGSYREQSKQGQVLVEQFQGLLKQIPKNTAQSDENAERLDRIEKALADIQRTLDAQRRP